jgi:hypothetical protein
MSQASTDPSALYLPEGDRFIPTVATIGPWDRTAQHGGPTAALLAYAIEHADAPAPMHVTRITYDLLRPIPLSPLEIRTDVVRSGKRVSVVDAVMLADDVAVMRASALRIRVADLDLPGDVQPDDAPPGAPGEGELAIELPGGPGYNDLGVEIRFLEGGFQNPGPATAWIRLRIPVVAEEEATPLLRAAAAADLGNGLSSVLPMREWRYINPDLSIHLGRPPVGEWVAMRSVTHPFGTGAGFAESALYDATGRIGRAVQSLFIDRQ